MEVGHLANALPAVGGEEFEAELDPADMVADPVGDGLGALDVRRVDGDENGASHGAGQTLLSVATRSGSGPPGALVVGATGRGARATLRSIGSNRRRSAHSRAR